MDPLSSRAGGERSRALEKRGEWERLCVVKMVVVVVVTSISSVSLW